jgi:hypothetical protein
MNNIEGENMGSEWETRVSELLKQRGWEIRGGNREGLVKVEAQGLVHCVDGRKGDKEDKMRGPKLQGGVLGVMALGVKRGDKQGLREAVRVVKEKGYVPGIHGDQDHGGEGCGFGKLWSQGQLEDLPKLELTPEEMREVVEEMGGAYVELSGGHEEKLVRANLVKGMTLVPEGDSFGLDVWAAEELGIDSFELVKNAVETVEKLNGPKIIEIIK